RAARAPPLEPVVRTAVDLDQLAKARPAFARRMNPLGSPPLGPRQPQFDLQPPNRLPRDRDPVQLEKLLGRQRRSEIRILLPQKPLDPKPDRGRQPQGGNASPLTRNQPRVARRPPRPQKPLHLPNAQVQPFTRRPLRNRPSRHLTQNVRTLSLRSAHRKNPQSHQKIPKKLSPEGTFSCCKKGTFSRCANTSSRRPRRP